jgi:hypothetical protein
MHTRPSLPEWVARIASRNTVKFFKKNPDYETFDPSKDRLWDELFTPNGGFLSKDLNGKRRGFGITMLHQLHCLQQLREAIQILAMGSNKTASHGDLHKRHQNDANPVSDVIHSTHFSHCFDYLRQVSLERTQTSWMATEQNLRLFSARQMAR